MRADCRACHIKEVKFQKVEKHEGAAGCIDCHMPRIVRSAWGNAEAYTGDIRVHLWAIEPDAMSQFSEDVKMAVSQISLDFACKACHRAGGPATAQTDKKLHDESVGYHERR